MSGYRGWSNYATWKVNKDFFFNKEEGFSGSISETADEMKAVVSKKIKKQTKSGVAREYALAFLTNVNWYELAEDHAIDGY